MITDKHFKDWNAETWGYGYGTGERPILTELKRFLSILEGNKDYPGHYSYWYKDIENELGKPVTWFLINDLMGADILEYGTSPRGGWLTEKGKLIKEYVDTKTVDELYEVVTDWDTETCYRGRCHCKGVSCDNPLFMI